MPAQPILHVVWSVATTAPSTRESPQSVVPNQRQPTYTTRLLLVEDKGKDRERKTRTALIRKLHPRDRKVQRDALLNAGKRRVRRAPRLLVDEDAPVEVVPVVITQNKS